MKRFFILTILDIGIMFGCGSCMKKCTCVTESTATINGVTSSLVTERYSFELTHRQECSDFAVEILSQGSSTTTKCFEN